MNARLPHLMAALVLHTVVIGLMVFGVQCSPRIHRPPVLEAVLLDPNRQEVATERRAEQRRQEERRRAEAEARKRREAEQQKQREQEQKKQAAAETARKKKEDEARRQKQAAEQKKLADQRAAERKAEEAARRKQAQDEQREKEAAARREREEQQRMEQAIRQETQDREAARHAAAQAASERQLRLAQWADALVRHIARNWVRPPGAADRFECLVQVTLLPDGTVTSAKIVKSCGNALLDKSVEDAVFRASPLPKPADPSVFERDLSIRFIPQS